MPDGIYTDSYDYVFLPENISVTHHDGAQRDGQKFELRSVLTLADEFLILY